MRCGKLQQVVLRTFKSSCRPFYNDHQQLYNRRQPAFLSVDEVDGLTLLEAAASTILQELEANLIDARRAAICFQKWGLKKQEGWRQIELMIYGVSYPQRCHLFSETLAVLAQVPGVSSVYFSLLAPHTAIAPHVGDTDAYYRVHLGLRVPAGLPACGMEVAGVQKAWREGRCLAFNDIYCHTAWNDTDQERIVLIVDILRPEFREQKIWVDSGLRATLYWSRLYERAWPLLELMPRVLTRLGRPCFHVISYVWHRLRNSW